MAKAKVARSRHSRSLLSMGARIVVVGSCMMDLVVRVPRHPLEGETLFGTDFGRYVGGKGLNQAVAAARAGASETSLVGRVGDDDFGRELKAYLKQEGVGTRHVTVDSSSGTGVAIPLVYDNGGNSILSVPRANLAMTAADIAAAREVIAAADLVLVQFEVSTEAVVAAVEIARQCQTAVVLNTAPSAPFPPGLEGRADIVVANEHEAAVLAPGVADAQAQAKALCVGATRTAIVTLGEAGFVAATNGGRDLFVAPAFPVPAIDSVGAGDAFCGTFAVRLAEGADPFEAALFASAAGALATTVRGAAPSLPHRAAIEALLGRPPSPGVAPSLK